MPVTAFVDWSAQMHNAGVRASDREGARHTLVRTTRLVERVLRREQSPFRVSFRLYHGWYRGWQVTDGYKAAVQAVVDTNFAALSGESVEFSPTVRYGHALLAALPERQHANPPIHLPNTLRGQARGQPPTEKMVDTALATDLLAWAPSISLRVGRRARRGRRLGAPAFHSGSMDQAARRPGFAGAKTACWPVPAP